VVIVGVGTLSPYIWPFFALFAFTDGVALASDSTSSRQVRSGFLSGLLKPSINQTRDRKKVYYYLNLPFGSITAETIFVWISPVTSLIYSIVIFDD
jgi:hypothetical protein